MITITQDNFEAEVMQSKQPVLLDFWAEWCPPCKMIMPVLQEIARERTDIKVGKVNIDEQSELAASFQVMSIPTLVVIKNGQKVSSATGALPKESILALLEA